MSGSGTCMSAVYPMLTTAGAVTPEAAAVVADPDDDAPVVDGAADFEEEEQAKVVTATITPRARTARVRGMGKVDSLVGCVSVNGGWNRRWCRWPVQSRRKRRGCTARRRAPRH